MTPRTNERTRADHDWGDEMAMADGYLSTDERSRLLADEVERYVARGFMVRAQTATTADLYRPRRFNPIVLVASMLLVGVGVFLFLGYYLLVFRRQHEPTARLVVDEAGRVHVGGEDPGHAPRTGGDLVVREYVLPRRPRPAVAAAKRPREQLLPPSSVRRYRSAS